MTSTCGLTRVNEPLRAMAKPSGGRRWPLLRAQVQVPDHLDPAQVRVLGGLFRAPIPTQDGRRLLLPRAVHVIGKAPRDLPKRGRYPQSKRTSRKASAFLESVVLHIDTLSRNVNERPSERNTRLKLMEMLLEQSSR
ncbi:unnamed protein product [Thlaspi arvense]|uniref:Uncharacterized protein n=1 Tax=Thlaspi arvense TaxID=13288 RepID=A0AAU9SJX4_THLAR|nr:unnamed protein product [Thlaspi arvense]